jgi:hypothetical protein
MTSSTPDRNTGGATFQNVVIDENGEFASSEDLDDLTAEEHTNLQSV